MKHIKGYLIYKLVIILFVCLRYFIPYDSDWFYLWFYAIWGSIYTLEFYITGPWIGFYLQKKYSIPILESVLFCPIVYYTTWLTILLGEISHNDTIQISATGTILFLVFHIITRLWQTVKLGKQ